MNLLQFTVKDLLVKQIRNEIIRGNLRPGARLRLRDLADQFKVSTQPIREALSELEAEGLVQAAPRKGAVVTVLTVGELIDLYEIRATLEAMATRTAVPHITPSTCETLANIIDEMDSHLGEAVELVTLNKQFHLKLYEASGRKHLCELISTLRNRTSHYLHAYMIDLGGMPLAQDEHRVILKACEAKDVETAVSIMHDHVLKAGDGIIAYVKREQKNEN
ncbi:MAG: GntR family transcriptional regulator [Chloroflexota bacterium]